MVFFVRKVDESFKPEDHFKDVPLYQTTFFRKWQERYDRNVISLVADDSDKKIQAYAQCVEYVFPVVGSVWIVACGPIGSFTSAASEEVFYKEMRSLCVGISPTTSHIRFQKKPVFQQIKVNHAEHAGGIFAQPLAEQVFLLERDLQDIADEFSPKTSRLTQKNNKESHNDVHFHIERKSFKQYLEAVYNLLKESEQMLPPQRSTLRPYAYYETLFDELDTDSKRGMLVLGHIEGKRDPVTFVLTIYSNSAAHHIFSGSSSVGFEHNIPTLAFYKTLQEAKKAGAKKYIVGKTDSVSSMDLRMLQEEFGGEEVSYKNLYDIVVSPPRYYLFRFLRLPPINTVRRLLMWIYKTVKHELTAED